ncbi:MAG: fatty acid desaturase [Bacteroidota bacterium]|nr:fatty acid desaturase [Bacteroidota bacterium]
MAFIDRILQEPAYGWTTPQGQLSVPSNKQLWSELWNRVNIFKSRKNWVSFIGWFWVICMLPFLFMVIFYYFQWYTVPLVALYSVVVMSVHGTIWYHRYSTHHAFEFSNPIWRFITQNLVIKVIPEEAYVVSHHVHHSLSDQPGDPYNATAGILYCFLADTNHQGIAKNMNEEDYKRTAGFLKHTGIVMNNYKQYQFWGSVANPWYTLGLWILNWSFWYTVFYFIGGHGLACTMFTGAMIWVVGVRVFNYTGHGNGEVRHVDGIDYDRSNLAINQSRPGWFAGEWHNNHHLFPLSARSGFLPYQLDLAWCYIYALYKIGGVSSFYDNKNDFYEKYVNVSKVKN